MDLPEWVKAGTSFQEVYGNENDTLWHVRGIVDGLAVCRFWRVYKQRWQYSVLDPIWFETLRGRLVPR